MPTRLLTTVEEARDLSRSWRASGRNVVLVPTMGDLHEGHLSLVRAGLDVGDVVVSIFVNPMQFAPGEDFESYPRRLEADRARLEEVGAAAIFAPSVEEIYPPGETTRVEVRQLSAPLCGQHREGHFLGVTTVCTKLFVGCEPDVAIFGQKDAQQCLVLWRLVRDLRLPVDLVFSPTIREKDGLAMSSRNRYLEGEQRDRAVTLARALGRGRQLLESGERDVATIEREMRSLLAAGADRPDYVELRRVPDLERLDLAEGRVLLAAAAYVGRARLIDNLCLEVGEAVREVPLLDAHTLQAVRARHAV
jgi:pantoate--beta-alanine ligase